MTLKSCGVVFVKATLERKLVLPSSTYVGMRQGKTVSRRTCCCWQHRGSRAKWPIVFWEAPTSNSANEIRTR
jgi:hypothetical protein